VIVLAVDPGYRESAWVTYDGARIHDHGIEPNEHLLDRLNGGMRGFGVVPPTINAVVFEQIESFGMAVGREVFETVFWTGRLYQAAGRITTRTERMTRREVKVHLCNSSKAKDSNIRTALIDRFGGSRESAIGIKAHKGPLYGITSDKWAALAVAVTWWDTRREDVQAVAAQFTDPPKSESRC
jgi:hypothetical protein